MSEIRQRYTTTKTSEHETSSMPHVLPSRSISDDGINASTLLNSSPSHHSQVMKLNIPVLFSLSPEWLQNILRYCPSPFKPSWNERYLIQIGKYLYRLSYKTGASHSAPQMKSKGSPIPLDQIQIKLISKSNILLDYDTEIRSLREDLPSFCDGFFSISFGGNTKYYACQTEEDAVTWVNSLQEGRQGAITNNMGHDLRPYPKNWKYIDTLGEQLYKKKDRIKEAIRRNENHQMEMMNLNDYGHSAMPRGFYG
jgi:hypothetical protein